MGCSSPFTLTCTLHLLLRHSRIARCGRPGRLCALAVRALALYMQSGQSAYSQGTGRERRPAREEAKGRGRGTAGWGGWEEG